MTGIHVPPHDRIALDVQRDQIVRQLRRLPEASRVRLPYGVLRALGRLNQMEYENEQAQEARRQENLATIVHYTAKVGDSVTICGARDERYGWVGEGNEFLNRAIDRGQAICPECLHGATQIEQSKP